ncbi:hypothetical protein B5D80_25945 [Micromonospora wenchangensis]|uniref:Uncharacterized protein n=1 Tax=Micromonospora wenchangensis TaxID=1185415 RepID=A0A246RFQ2_9ACTN|nr:DUF6114 domain-containing protein [Micromonospora wenchangensis]OWV01642.1 hypothetical protein B5D80_25945 [Micromonospora wenchangensis]
MTSAQERPARQSRIGQAWRAFRRWRRARPFWGGLLTALAGLEIFATTQMSLGGLTFQMGPTGFLSWLIPVILVTCGMLMWFTPQQRLFYAVIAAVTAVYSLIGVNLGGFFIGLFLGMVGSALGFAWVPARAPAPLSAADRSPAEGGTAAQEGAAVGEAPLVDELMPPWQEEHTTGPLTDTLPPPRNPLREAVRGDREGAGTADTTQILPTVEPDGGPYRPNHRDPRLYATLLVLTTTAMATLLAVRGAQPALAEPACPGPTKTASAPSAPPSVPASPSPTPAETPDGNLLTDIIDGITDLFTGGDEAETTAASPTPEPGASRPAVGTGVRPGPGATVPATGSTPPAPTASSRPGRGTCGKPLPRASKRVEVGKPLPRIAPEPGQPTVARQPSKLTGTRVTMTGLRFEGIVDLPTADGTLKALKFSMSRAVTTDFSLVADGPAGRHQRYVTDELTVQGDVAFYATRFVGKLLGITITLTPDLPLPDGIPVTSPIPITFTDPAIDLAFVDSDTLTARPALALSLS